MVAVRSGQLTLPVVGILFYVVELRKFSYDVLST